MFEIVSKSFVYDPGKLVRQNILAWSKLQKFNHERLKLLSLLKFFNIFQIIFLGCVDDLVFASVVPHLFLYDLLLLNNGLLHARLDQEKKD